jgi:DNA-directed RNA polymerase subunit RPC12/RpoP
MTQELDKKLCEKYPKIFADRHGDMRNTAMCWGICTGDGWYWLIDKLCSQLQWNTDYNNEDGRYPQVVASQVKEKFGDLRFYVKGASEVEHAIISWAETLSGNICERCGSTKDVTQTEGWIYTECPDCRFKRETSNRRRQYLWWVLISPKSGWFQRRYIFGKIYQTLYNTLYKPLTTIKTKLTTYKV